MEYVIMGNRGFEEIEALITQALEHQGLVVQRTFSLHSAAGVAMGDTDTFKTAASSPGYSVLMIFGPGASRRPLGLLTLYQRGARTVLSPVLTPTEDGRSASPGGRGQATPADADAQLVAALVLSRLEFCVEIAKGEECIELPAPGGESMASERLVLDPVCGKWLDLRQVQAGIEYEGNVYHVCCPLCQEAFEHEPARYARTG